MMSVHHPVLWDDGKLLYMSPDFAGTSMDPNAVSESLSLPSAFITSPVFVGVICPTGFVYMYISGGTIGITSIAPGERPPMTTGLVMKFRDG